MHLETSGVVQLYTGRLCKRCNYGYYPWFGECVQCPDGFAWTAKNTLTVIYRYGIIWLLWIVVNRFLCETLMMADSLLNFAQMYVAWFAFYVACFLRSMSHAFCSAGVLGGFDLNWPTSLAWFLSLCGILDFDIDVTGYTLLRCFSLCNLL